MKTELKQNYYGLVVYNIAKVIDVGDKYRIDYITVSTIPWTVDGDLKDFIPLNPLVVDEINLAFNEGKDVYIIKNWGDFSREVVSAALEINPIADLTAYKRRAMGFIKSFINPQMAKVHASIIYGFTTLNNKFIEKGYVFSEENKTLKYIEIIEKSEEILEDQTIDPQIAQNLSDELTNDLEKYIEYREILDRANFIWNESEKYIEKIDEIEDSKEAIDDIVIEFQTKINTLNNIK